VNKIVVITFLLALIACSKTETPVTETSSHDTDKMSVSDYLATPKTVDLLVYKSPTCGCCADWVKHMNEAGFTSEVKHPEHLLEVKRSWNIGPEFQSCHTAVSREGYVFEGHIPAHVIQRFLAEKPANAIGLAVAGMPIGSPGMEMGGKFEPYDVRLLRKNGSSVSFTRITGPR